MTRRLRMAGTAMAAFLVPACTGVQPEATVIKPAPVPPGGSQRLAAHPVMIPAARGNQTAEKFADRRGDPTPSLASRPAPLVDMPLPRLDVPPTEEVTPPETVVSPPAPATTPTTPTTPNLPELPPPAAGTPAAAETPRVILPARNVERGKDSVPEPKTDAEGVIRPQWPVLKGTLPLVDPDKEKPVTPPPAPSVDTEKPATPSKVEPGPLTLPEPVKATPKPVLPPPPLPAGVLGTTTHHSNSAPLLLEPPITKVEHSEPVTLPPTGGDTPLIRAVRSFQQNRPDSAVEELKSLDGPSQQAMLSLLPALVRLGEGKLADMSAEELDKLIEQVGQVPLALKPRASLRADNVRLCREVHNFGHVEPFPPGHTLRPGDIVYLYQELGNFSCVADGKGQFNITLTSALEMKNPAGAAVWRADPKEAADCVSSVPQDYYRNFRLCIPNVPPGTYTLAVKTTDRPTGREVTKSIELHVGPK